MDERERFDGLLEVLDALKDANDAVPIVVEGQRDVAALRALGCSGMILPLHNGRTLFAVAEEVARVSPTAILLTDWDRKGGQLLETLAASLEACGVRVDLTFRGRLADGRSGQIKDVESLAPYVQRRLLRYHRIALEDRFGAPATG